MKNSNELYEDKKAVKKLTQIDNGHAAKVIETQGGPQFVSKLEAMGIRSGTVIVKKSASLLKGPIVIEKGATQFAIGYNMAERIIVEPLD